PAATPAPATAPVATVPPAATSAPTVAAKPTAAAATVGLAKPQAGLVPGQIGVSKSVALPTRVPIPGAKPDLPGSADGLIDPGYVNYPATPFKAVAEKPGSGGDVTVATWTLAPPPAAMESNALWQ